MRGAIWRVKMVGVLASIVLIAMLAVGCGVAGYGAPASSGSGSSTSGTTAGAPGAGIVTTTSATVSGRSETVLSDAQDHTLYYNNQDTGTTSACTTTTGCSNTWPPLIVSSGTPTSTNTLPGTLNAQDVGNGMQVLYNGHPLYRYSGDTAAGQANGDGIEGIWHVATPNLTTSAGSSSTPVSTPCSGYYCGG